MSNSEWGKHPNSIKNLKPIRDAKTANERREKGLEVRRANKEKRAEMAKTLDLFKRMGYEDIPKGLDVLRIQMANAIINEDMDEATRLAAIVAPYETPKLQAQEITQTVTHEDASDEELARMAEELGIDISTEDIH